MKKATSTFVVDNGTVYEGQQLPDGHPAVDRYPGNFVDVPADVDVEQVDGTVAEHGVIVDGTGETTPASVPAAPAETNGSESGASSAPSS